MFNEFFASEKAGGIVLLLCAVVSITLGFTMSIFVTLLAFHDDTMIIASKIAIMAASAIAGLILLAIKLPAKKLNLDADH